MNIMTENKSSYRRFKASCLWKTRQVLTVRELEPRAETEEWLLTWLEGEGREERAMISVLTTLGCKRRFLTLKKYHYVFINEFALENIEEWQQEAPTSLHSWKFRLAKHGQKAIQFNFACVSPVEWVELADWGQVLCQVGERGGAVCRQGRG